MKILYKCKTAGGHWIDREYYPKDSRDLRRCVEIFMNKDNEYELEEVIEDEENYPVAFLNE